MATVLKTAIKMLNKKISAKERQVAVSALDAILSVDTTAPDALTKFNSALKTHAKFWVTQDTKNPPQVKASDDLAVLKQLAAEQRVLLGLQNANSQVLIELLGHQNEDALRSYMSNMTSKKLEHVPGWNSEPPAPNPGKSILTAEALKRIKDEAAVVLLAQQIAATNDHALLKNLVLADDPDKIKVAVRALGVEHDVASIPADIKETARKLYVKSAYSALVAAPDAFPGLSAHVGKEDVPFKAHMQSELGQVDISDEEIQDAKIKLNTAFDKYINKSYSAYVTGARVVELLPAVGNLLIADNPVFLAHMRNVLSLPMAQFSPEQIKSARTELATSYLERILTDTPLTLIAEDINDIDSVDKMLTFISKPPLNESHENITAAVTETSLKSLKLLMLKKFIENLPIDKVAALEKLQSVKDLNGLKPVLGQMGIKPDWVDAGMMEIIRNAGQARLDALRVDRLAAYTTIIAKQTNIDSLIKFANITELDKFRLVFKDNPEWIDTHQMGQLQQLMRNRALDLKVASSAKFRPEQHAKLIDVLHRLPEKKQLELLEPTNLALEHLLKSSDDSRFKHYLGDTIKIEDGSSLTVDRLVRDIIQENARVASFQKVQNSAFAKILAGFGTSAIPEDPTGPGGKLLNCPTVPTLTPDDIRTLNEQLKNIDFSKPDEIKALADLVIKLPLDTDTKQKANAGLVAFITAQSVALTKQQTINEPLANIYPSLQKEPIKALFDVLLRLDADVSYASDSGLNNRLNAVLNKHYEKVEDFITAVSKVFASPGKEKNLEAALKKELSQTEYRAIANGWKKELLAHGGSPEQKTALLTSIVNTMKAVEPLLKLAKPLEIFAENQSTGSIYDVATREYGAAAKKAAYLERLEANTVTIDRLLRAEEQLKGYLAVLPIGSKDSQINKIREELKKDLQKLEEAIKHCKAAQDKIISTIEEINRIMAGKEHYLYSAPDIIHKKLEDTDRAAFFTSGAAHVSGVINVPHEIAKKIALEGGQTSYISTVTEKTDPAKPTIGQFKQTFAANTQSEVNSEGRISHKVNVKVEMIEPPKHQDGSAGAAHAQVNMYMNMALALIVANGHRPPTEGNPIRLSGGTDKEMERLWTALHIICKEKYGYTHAEFMKAVKIDTGGFDPDEVMTKRRLREPVFNAKSEFTTVFHNDTKSERALGHKLDDVDKIKVEKQKFHEQGKPASKALDDYKAAMSSTRTEEALKASRELREKEEVVNPANEVKPTQLRN